jgi:CRISPR system Cascade subunit CasA
MNLAEEPWIPVLFADGSPGCVSLREAFARGSHITDLAVRPHERIALMRLLVCIAQAALDGPADRSDWLSCRERIPAAVEAYLSGWQHAFELFGDGQRFLQVPNLEPQSGSQPDTPITKLDVAMATGNNATLFDNGGGTERIFEPVRAALALLTFQCFSPGGRIGVALWAGKPTGSGSSEHAPCISRSMLHTYVRGGDLCATVHLNVLHKQQVQELVSWGYPVWERWPQSSVDKDRIQNATETYLGRLVPISRGIHLRQNSERILNSNALAYPQQREATATELLKEGPKGTERTVVSASLEKATWRELSAITVKRTEGGGPLSLQNLSDDEDFDLWTGGLVAEKAKLVGTVESVFHVPAAMAREAGQRIYEAGVKLAERGLQRALGAVSAYWREYSRSAGKKPNKEGLKEKLGSSRQAAERFFWTVAEQGVPDLLAAVANGAESWSETPWGKLVQCAARESLEAACPSSTPRQIRAFSEALRFLEVRNDKTSRRSGSKKNR